MIYSIHERGVRKKRTEERKGGGTDIRHTPCIPLAIGMGMGTLPQAPVMFSSSPWNEEATKWRRKGTQDEDFSPRAGNQ